MARAAQWTILSALSVTLSAEAALFILPDDRFVYDDVLDITWLRDTRAIAGSGYDVNPSRPMDPVAPGSAGYGPARAWVAQLSFTLAGPAGSATFSDWRLPSALEVAPSQVEYRNDGLGDGGYNITRPSSELSHLFYVSLGNQGNCGIVPHCPATGGGLTNSGPFLNVSPWSAYWSSTSSSTMSGLTWVFEMSGRQVEVHNSYALGVWAVHPGQVMAPVPEPYEWAMMLAGLGVVGLSAKRRRRSPTAAG